jgi:glutamate racemase
MSINTLPIGIFDSGVGGLTVYRALHDRLPNEHFVYIGDTARVPYGTKSLATVERYAIENSQFLASRGIKLLVVACNTASALALPKIREKIGLDVVGVIGPGGRKAIEIAKCDNPKIGVIATEATVASGAYSSVIKRACENASIVRVAVSHCLFRLPRRAGPRRQKRIRSRKKYLAPMREFAPGCVGAWLHPLPDPARRDSANDRRRC